MKELQNIESPKTKTPNKKIIPMKKIALILMAGILVAACNGKPEVEAKKEELKGYQSEIKELNLKIAALEEDIKKLDPTYGVKEIKKTLITTIDVKPGYFEHKVDVRGTVESRRNVTVGSEIPGKIVRVHVAEGQKVMKGQTLVSLDASIIKNNIAELKTALELAETVYERQSNLWKRNIGTEIQYLQSKNNYESLQRRLATSNSQLDQAIIKAPFNGSIDKVIAKEGEITQPGITLLRIVNPLDVYIKSDVSERFIGVFNKGDEVDIYFPVQDKILGSRIASVGQVINDQNRTFEIEVEMPNGLDHTRPNQVVVLKMRDYTNDEAIKVPTMIIQKDSRGSYVYKIEKQGENLVASKAHVTAGVTYENTTEILSGIQEGQQIAHKGYRDLSEGTHVMVSKSVAQNSGSKK
ncbi:MAG: efflux RND transporter periplasmic adaptor subunit [Cyclobacteriaceae bacterium]